MDPLHAAADTTDVGDDVPSGPVPGPHDPGDAIGPYIVEAPIGAGAMGIVYRARDPRQGRQVALKLLRARAYRSGSSASLPGPRAEWLRNEARALARLDHPNVVRVHGVGNEQGRVYLSMELLEGDTLRTWAGVEPRTWPERARMLVAAARGLAAAHDAGIVHGDFKPDNVMVTRDGVVKVMDFGLARIGAGRRHQTTDPMPAASSPGVMASGAWDAIASSDSSTSRTRAMMASDETSAERRWPRGTPAYMAPEVVAGETGDARSDQFALCVSMYEVLFGRRPYGGRTAAEIAFRITRGDLRMVPRERGVPGWLHAAVTRGLALEPGARWPSVAALADALDAGLVRRERRRATAVAAATVAGILATLVARSVLG